jgi:hypothetical protein
MRGLKKPKNDCRRCLTNRFPYELIYSIKNDSILILAVTNQHRHPDFCKNRS